MQGYNLWLFGVDADIRQIARMLHLVLHTTCLNVGTIVNAPLYNSLYLFLSFLPFCHPYILTIFGVPKAPLYCFHF